MRQCHNAEIQMVRVNHGPSHLSHQGASCSRYTVHIVFPLGEQAHRSHYDLSRLLGCKFLPSVINPNRALCWLYSLCCVVIGCVWKVIPGCITPHVSIVCDGLCVFPIRFRPLVNYWCRDKNEELSVMLHPIQKISGIWTSSLFI